MINDKAVAAEISQLMMDMSRQLNASLIEVQERCSEAEFIAYRQVVGQLMGDMYVDVMRPIYAVHPELTPEGLLD